MATPEVNPLKQIHDAFWTMLEARTDFCNLILAGNRIKTYDADGFGLGEPDVIDQRDPSGSAAVRVIQTGSEPSRHSDTSHTAIVLVWEIQILTGRRYINTLLDVLWAIYRAMEGWTTYTRDALTWHDDYFFKSCEPTLSVDKLDNASLHKAIQGWTTVLTVKTECWFAKSEMLTSST